MSATLIQADGGRGRGNEVVTAEAPVRVRRLVGRRLYERIVRGGGWLTTDEAMRLLGVSRRTVFYLIERGVLHPRKVRGRLRFPVDEALRAAKRGGAANADEG